MKDLAEEDEHPLPFLKGPHLKIQANSYRQKTRRLACLRMNLILSHESTPLTQKKLNPHFTLY